MGAVLQDDRTLSEGEYPKEKKTQQPASQPATPCIQATICPMYIEATVCNLARLQPMVHWFAFDKEICFTHRFTPLRRFSPSWDFWIKYYFFLSLCLQRLSSIRATNSSGMLLSLHPQCTYTRHCSAIPNSSLIRTPLKYQDTLYCPNAMLRIYPWPP